MDEYILTCLQDILDAITEVESYFIDIPMQYEFFEKDYLRRSAVERKVEIMGEALNRIFRKYPTFDLPNAKEVVRTRNRVIHGYDSVTPDFLWLLIIRYIPQLKEDILSMLLPHEGE
jgi:uncharacterized protein with HEPN domain